MKKQEMKKYHFYLLILLLIFGGIRSNQAQITLENVDEAFDFDNSNLPNGSSWEK